jgi:uncharacterized protein YqeY
MAFIDIISQAIADATRARDQVRLGALRMAKAALMNREVEKGRALDDAEGQQVIASLIKQRRDSIEQFQKFGRDELARKEQAEITVLEAYVPAPLDQAAIEQAVADAVAETGASSLKDVGKVMKVVMGRLAGQTVDGKTVNELVRRRLAG